MPAVSRCSQSSMTMEFVDQPTGHVSLVQITRCETAGCRAYIAESDIMGTGLNVRGMVIGK